MSNHILLVDDDTVLSGLLKEYFEGEGFTVQQAFTGKEAVDAVNANPIFKVVVLDVMMPKMDGFEALQIIRRNSKVPIIMLTAKGDDIDRILGLEMGADDYVPKPCNPRELLARIKAILRRTENVNSELNKPANLVSTGDVKLNPAVREVYANEILLQLTNTEFSVLEVLMRSENKLVRKNALSEDILGKKLGPYDRSLDMHISNLRKKLDRAKSLVVIKTIRSHGFILVAAATFR